ncbi:TlpA family protein disulfide reductase [Clostridium butyricum]|uniref:Putative alkyl hydroperoxide reductase/ Thiol specific antioxidant/ Mal allergen n=1 Tax=Clostridium butyricum E4 str. BoNT E BL5262 TaxID=632245 RepID=C4IGI6_CLOBU|nr:TlpA disulfide reductase family protein [Clostridium butyricum]EDT75924.1 putative thioredoxin family protein [Clostridium butyricum 5521]EEP52929.1 putative alkyl hydroperoxide reductase/ Thiol specific antioxidant/ Mal allergen [Clostridium butyricum E4 str. BoNT E BL5262]NFL32960.1 TlpA family protein disulfide reductase [Clostridium butyricum]NFS18639.1 TlpA family protein disulfide reductase [Clostridium butyricum]
MILKIIFIGLMILIGFCIISLIVFNKDVEKKMKNREKIEHIKFSSKTIFYEDIDSHIFSQRNFTLVNIWGTYCSSCIKELPYLQEIFDEFKDSNMGVLGIVADLKMENYKEKDLKKAISVIEENNIKYPNIFADSTFVEYAKGKLFVIPTTIFVDNQGRVIGEIIESAYSKEDYIEIIKKILNNDTTFIIQNSNLRCSIDGKCEIKK